MTETQLEYTIEKCKDLKAESEGVANGSTINAFVLMIETIAIASKKQTDYLMDILNELRDANQREL